MNYKFNKIQFTNIINDFKARIASDLTHFWLSKFDLAYFRYKPKRIETGRN